MRKILTAGALAVFTLFLPPRSHAAPLDVPYQLSFSTISVASKLIISSTTIPSLVSSINSNVASSQWCLSHVATTMANEGTFSIFWSTSPFGFNTGTTDYMVTTSTGMPYDSQWAYRNPYCAPVGASIVTLISSVAGSTITAEGYLFKGWTP